MTTLLIAEHDNATVKDATAKALTAAAQLGAPVHLSLIHISARKRAGCRATARFALRNLVP